jgi:hypothetical protein
MPTRFEPRGRRFGVLLSTCLCMLGAACAGPDRVDQLPDANISQAPEHQAHAAIITSLSDNFTKDEVLKKQWILTQLNPASYYRVGSSGLLLEASGENGGSDLWSGTGYRASLLLLPISPKANWTITTHFIFAPEIDFQAAGLILTTQKDNFDRTSQIHRFELSYQNRQNGLGVASYTNGPIDPAFAPFSGKEIFLKLEKAGSEYRYSYRTVGHDWKLVSVIADPSPYTYVGLDSIRQPWHGSTTLDSKPVFKSFRIVPDPETP